MIRRVQRNKKIMGFNVKSQRNKSSVNLMEGPIIKNILLFAIPLFMGQLLQQFYNMADAWVIGNFADNDAFAAVSSAGSMTFLIVGLFNGIAIGGGVIISKYFGAGDKENVMKAIHTNFLFGILDSCFFILPKKILKRYTTIFNRLFHYIIRYLV